LWRGSCVRLKAISIKIGVLKMPEVEEMLSHDEKDLLQRFSLQAVILIILLYALFFWAGVNFLREDIFKHNFNPSRHLIVSQNPDTFEILVWKDALGNVYTSDDIQVKLFPLAVCALGLAEVVVFSGLYYLMKWHYTIMLLFRRIARSGERRAGAGILLNRRPAAK